MSNFILDDLKNAFRAKGNGLTQIILINVIVYILVNIIDQFIQLSSATPTEYYDLSGEFMSWMALPADLGYFIFRFWTLLTYMFLHEGFLHILFNMLWVYWFGKILRQHLGNKSFVSTYLLGGFAGGILYMVVYNSVYLFDVPISGISINSILIGASASVMAVVFAAATKLPNHSITLIFIGAIRLKYIALFALVFTTLLDFSSNVGGNLAHLGGALYGYLYIRNLQRGIDISSGFNRMTDRITSVFKRGKTIKVVYKRPKSDDAFNAHRANEQQKTDEILDKISKSGYDSLSKEEKEFLFRVSNRK